MIQKFNNFKINTNGQKLYEFTDQTINWIKKNKFKNGILNLSIQHTSASLIIQENADPDVQTDLINYFNKLAPMDNKLYIHTTEGKDDMPAHIKSSLTNNQISCLPQEILELLRERNQVEEKLDEVSNSLKDNFFLIFNCYNKLCLSLMH